MNRGKIQAVCVALLTVWAITTPAGFAAETTSPPTEGVKPETPGAPTPPLPAGVQELRYDGGLLTLKAEKADLRAVLQAVGGASGVEVAIQEGIAGTVTLRLETAGLEEAIRKIVEAGNGGGYGAEFEGQAGAAAKLTKVTVVRRGAGQGQAATAEGAKKPRKWGPESFASFEVMGTFLTDKLGREWTAAKEEGTAVGITFRGAIAVQHPLDHGPTIEAVMDDLVASLQEVLGVRTEDLHKGQRVRGLDGYPTESL